MMPKLIETTTTTTTTKQKTTPKKMKEMGQWVGLSEQKPIFGKTNHLHGCLFSCFNNCCSLSCKRIWLKQLFASLLIIFIYLFLFWSSWIRLTWTMIFEARSRVTWVTFTRCATMIWSGIVTRTRTDSGSIATGLATGWPCSPVRPHSINWGTCKNRFLIIIAVMNNMK